MSTEWNSFVNLNCLVPVKYKVSNLRVYYSSGRALVTIEVCAEYFFVKIFIVYGAHDPEMGDTRVPAFQLKIRFDNSAVLLSKINTYSWAGVCLADIRLQCLIIVALRVAAGPQAHRHWYEEEGDKLVHDLDLH